MAVSYALHNLLLLVNQIKEPTSRFCLNYIAEVWGLREAKDEMKWILADSTMSNNLQI